MFGTDLSKTHTLVKGSQSTRKRLPHEMVDRSKLSIWSILKQCVDKELYRFTIPIIWNEPLSLLQRMAENMKYSHELLDTSATLQSGCDRMKLTAGFLIASTSVHAFRLSKPFNPLLGETYELVSSEKNFRICCEQVSHHPPISAVHSESLKMNENQVLWKYYGSVNPHMKLNVLSACVEAFPEGIQTIEFPHLGETYTYHNLKVSAHNLILGKLWFEYTGRTEIINHKLKLKCILDFKPYSWFKGQVNRVEGYILDANDNKIALLSGKWDEYFYATNDVDNSNFYRQTEKLRDCDLKKTKINFNSTDNIQLIWKSNDPIEILPDFYNFTQFTFSLNELHDDLLKPSYLIIKNNDSTMKHVSIGPLPQTDARLRTDLRMYENGQVEAASNEKNRLEEKQRETQRKIESSELEQFKPLWFERTNHSIVSDEETWTFNDLYWNRDFSQCSNIY